MSPTQSYDDGARSYEAYKDDFQKCEFSKYADGDGNLSEDNASRAAQEVLMKWKHLNMAQSQTWINDRFAKVWKTFDPRETGKIHSSTMYGLINELFID